MLVPGPYQLPGISGNPQCECQAPALDVSEQEIGFAWLSRETRKNTTFFGGGS